MGKILWTIPQCIEAEILVENFHRQGRVLKSALNFLGKSPCISLGFSDRDRSLKQVRTLGTLEFRPQVPWEHKGVPGSLDDLYIIMYKRLPYGKDSLNLVQWQHNGVPGSLDGGPFWCRLCNYLSNFYMTRFYDNTTGSLVHSMVAHLDAVTSLAVDQHGLYLISGSHDCSIRSVWFFLSSQFMIENKNSLHQYSILFWKFEN
jgi:hypothetical protein